MKVLQLRAKKGIVHRRCKPNALEKNLSKMAGQKKTMPPVVVHLLGDLPSSVNMNGC